MKKEEAYIRLKNLVQNMPEFTYGAAVTADQIWWLSQIHAVMNEVGDLTDKIECKKIVDGVIRRLGLIDAHDLVPMLYRTLAILEHQVNLADTGVFIGAGNALDAMAAVSRVLDRAKISIMVVDPYMDEKALTDFASLCSDGVKLELLADSKSVNQTFFPALSRFKTQYSLKPIEARLTPPKSLHDRLIVVDGTEVWLMSQSLNAFAKRSPASIVQMQGDAVTLKLQAYQTYWNNATPVP